MIHRRHPATFVAAAILLFATPVHADPEFDALASVQWGDDLGGRPIALATTDDGGVIVIGNDGGGGTLVRLDGEPPMRVSQSLHDVAVDDRTDIVAVIGDAALQVFEPDLSLGWSVDLPAPGPDDPRRRIDIGDAGTIAIASGSSIRMFSPDGRSYGALQSDAASFGAVAVVDGEALVIATGWVRTRAGDHAGLWAVQRDGTASWQATARSRSRGVDVVFAPDGFVYALAEAFEPRPLFADGAHDIASDAYTSIGDIASQRFAHYSRWDLGGTLDRGQSFGFADETSRVEPRAIEADSFGRVHISGLTTHRLDPTDRGDAALAPETLEHPSGFVLTVPSEFDGRDDWRALQVDAPSDASGLSLAADALHVLLDAPQRSAVIAVANDPTGQDGRRPDRDDVGTFGYESGVSGADPTCYCGPTQRPARLWLLVLALFGLARRRRPNRPSPQ